MYFLQNVLLKIQWECSMDLNEYTVLYYIFLDMYEWCSNLTFDAILAPLCDRPFYTPSL